MSLPDARSELQATLGDAYTLERELGGGGMSRVWLATETALGRQVVVKVISPELREGLSAERFTREVRLAARLQQANIVPLLSAGTSAGAPWYTMPFVSGESLRARLASGAPPSLTERTSILRDVARALAYAHGEGVVHRDIKPENVLLSHGTAVVTDFGIAKALTAARALEGAAHATLTQAGGTIGTPAYMAPEQAVGDAVDHRTDLYAWGVMAYELLAGAHPFARHTTAQALVTAHLTEPPPAFTPAQGVPPGLAALVMRCLEKDPARRPESAADLLRGLDQVSTSGPGIAAAAPRRHGLAIAAALLLAGGLGGWLLLKPGATPAAQEQKSLAVLPFESVGGDTANAYFAEGIGEELTTALAQLPGLRVAGRSSAMRFKGKGASAQEVGSALGVNSVLDGTVRRAGGRVRITAQLTSATDGLVIWTDSYERESKDVFELQDEISRAIVAALQVRLAAGPVRPGAATGTTNLEAYDLYLRALSLYRRRGAGLRQAEALLEEARTRDSGFARAHALLATVLVTQPYHLPVHIGDMIPRAKAAAERAIALDPGLSEGHQALGMVHLNALEWEPALREIRQAIALDPTSSEAEYRLGFILYTAGRPDEAIPAFQRAKQHDPLYLLPAAYLGNSLTLTGQLDAGLAESRRAFELDTTVATGISLLVSSYYTAGRTAEALATADRLMRMHSSPVLLASAAFPLARSGDQAVARALVARLEAMPADAPRRSATLAYLYLGLGDTTRALSAMERAAAGDGDLLFTVAPFSETYDAVRASPRFAAVLRRYNLDVARLTAPRGSQPR
jgi:TolB-like protein/Tfp pilus assembly protein PilF